MGVIFNLILIIVAVIAISLWIYNLIKWDGKYHCRPEDCENCPFPECSEEQKQSIFKETEEDERNHNHST